MSNEFFDKLNRSSQYSFFKEFKPSDEVPLRKDDYENLLITVETILDDKEFGFIGGTAILTNLGHQIIVVARNERIASDLKKSAEIIRDMDEVKVFFESLPESVEVGGLGHLEFEYFEMFFGDVQKGRFAVAFQVIDDKKEKIPLMNFYLEEVKNIFAEIDFSSKEGVVTNSGTSPTKSVKSSPSGSPRPTMTSTPEPTMTSAPSAEISETKENKKDTKDEDEKTKRSTPANVDPITGKPKKLMTREDYKISLATRLKELED